MVVPFDEASLAPNGKRSTLSEASRGKRLLVFASGSRGDVQPFAALGAALQDAGFVLRVLTNVNHVGFYKGFGLDAVGTAVDAEKWLKEDLASSECMAKGQVIKLAGKMAEFNKREFPGLLQRQLREFREFRPDLILSSFLEGTQAKAVGGVGKVPVILCGLTPFCATPDEPSMMNEPEWLPGWVHLLAWRAIAAVFISGEKDGKHPALLQQLPDCKPFLVQSVRESNYAFENAVTPSLYGISTAICPMAKAFPAGSRAIFTGFWVVGQGEQERRMMSGDAEFGGTACASLGRFLAAGDAPAYIGWGSMLSVSSEHMACLAVRALRLAGARGVVLGGWADLTTDRLRGQADSEELLAYAEENVIFATTAPHEWLFPRCFATVHHGGSGTTAAALRSGRPTIVVPCGLDQFSNARMAASSGAGLRLPQLADVTPAQLAEALRRARADQGLVARAAAVGEQLRSEDGLTSAVEAVDRFIREEVVTGVWERRHKAQTAELQRISRAGPLRRLGSLCCGGG